MAGSRKAVAKSVSAKAKAASTTALVKQEQPGGAANNGKSKILPEVAGLSVDDKILAFRKAVTTQKGTIDAKAKLREYFTAGVMSNLWGKLGRVMKGAKVLPATKESWDDICKKGWRDGKAELKNEALAMQIAFPKDWEEQWVATVRSITQTKTSGFDEREYTKGPNREP